MQSSFSFIPQTCHFITRDIENEQTHSYDEIRKRKTITVSETKEDNPMCTCMARYKNGDGLTVFLIS